MARCVFPVLVGPSTAVTPAPRARRSRSVEGEKEIGIEGPGWRAAQRLHLYHNMTLESAVLKVWNESGTNRGRIGDSRTVRLRSRDIWRQPRGRVPDRGYGRFSPLLFSSKVLTVFGITIPPGVKALAPVNCGDAGARKPVHRQDHCVLVAAVDRGGRAIDTNCLACNNAMPIGVGIETRNGTTTRVPEIGAIQTSASCSSTRYLMAGLSGT